MGARLIGLAVASLAFASDEARSQPAWSSQPRWSLPLDPSSCVSASRHRTPGRCIPPPSRERAPFTRRPRAKDDTRSPEISVPFAQDATDLMGLGPSQCRRALAAAGVTFVTLDPASVPAVAQPIRLAGPMHGVTFRLASSRDPARDHHAIWDCRLALALVPLARDLAARRVEEIVYFSVLRGRNGQTRSRSMHHTGLAIDILGFAFSGAGLSRVEDDFPRGQWSCQPPAHHSRRNDHAAQTYVAFVCLAAQNRRVHTLLTPDYDRAHHDHLHLDLKPNEASPADPFVSFARLASAHRVSDVI